MRRNAAWTLGRQRDARLVEPLIAALDDADGSVRVRVVEALGNQKDERVIEPLARVLERDSDAEVRAYAARALGNTGDGRAVDALISALDDAEGVVRAAAASALGAIPDPRAAGPLVRALLNDPDAQFNAAHSLAQIGGAHTVDLLIDALKTGEAAAKITMIETLGQLGDKRAVEPLKPYLDDPDEGIRETARWALRQLGYS